MKEWIYEEQNKFYFVQSKIIFLSGSRSEKSIETIGAFLWVLWQYFFFFFS